MEHSAGTNAREDKFEHDVEGTMEKMFSVMKDKKSGNVQIYTLFNIIERTGIQRDDPRLQGMIKKIQRRQKECMKTENGAKLSYTLDLKTFKEIVREDFLMMLDILQNDFIVPEFKGFSDEIDAIYEICKSNSNGAPADYIPQLARFDPKLWAVCVCTVDGQRHKIGDYEEPFCIQSASKPLNYALALTELGADIVHQYVGYEPSGVSFNSLSLSEEFKPHNPLINSGAICVCSLIKNKEKLADRFDYVMNEYKKLAGGEYIEFNNPTFLSERNTADRNFALSYYMKENQCFPQGTDIHEVLDLYFQLCSVEITCESGSVIAATLANGGICPLTGERVLSGAAVRDTLSLMYSCGMYDYSGQFAFKVGLPAKSGVSGVILLVVPGLLGICMWAPPLDKQGNSSRGVQFCEELVSRFSFHNYDSLIHAESPATQKHDPRKSKSEQKSKTVVTLMFSAANNDVSSLRREHLADVDMGQCDYDGRTALHVAAAEGHMDCVEYLVEECKVECNPKDRWGFTPVDDARKFNFKRVEEYLVQHLSTHEN